MPMNYEYYKQQIEEVVKDTCFELDSLGANMIWLLDWKTAAYLPYIEKQYNRLNQLIDNFLIGNGG